MNISAIGRIKPKVGDVAKRYVQYYTVKYCLLNAAMENIPVDNPSLMSNFVE